MNKTKIINLIGSKLNINLASIEIREYLFLKKLGVKIIENNKIMDELNKGIQRDFYIHKSEINEKIKKENIFNNKFKNNFFNLFIISDKNFKGDYKNKNLYNLEEIIDKKHKIIEDILLKN